MWACVHAIAPANNVVLVRDYTLWFTCTYFIISNQFSHTSIQLITHLPHYLLVMLSLPSLAPSLLSLPPLLTPYLLSLSSPPSLHLSSLSPPLPHSLSLSLLPSLTPSLLSLSSPPSPSLSSPPSLPLLLSLPPLPLYYQTLFSAQPAIHLKT